MPGLGEPLPRTEKKGLVRVCERILRGRAADKRVTSSAGHALASVLEFLMEQDLSPASVTTTYRPAPAQATGARGPLSAAAV